MLKKGHRYITSGKDNVWLIHSITTAVAAMLSLSGALLLNLEEFYWAPISTLIVMQSTLGASWDTSKQRFLGTILGAVMAGVFYELNIMLPLKLGMGVFIMGLICAGLHMVLGAFRFAGVTYAIIVLLPHTERAWLIGLHRFIEVALGIAVALVVTAIGPDHPFSRQ